MMLLLNMIIKTHKKPKHLRIKWCCGACGCWGVVGSKADPHGGSRASYRRGFTPALPSHYSPKPLPPTIAQRKAAGPGRVVRG